MSTIIEWLVEPDGSDRQVALWAHKAPRNVFPLCRSNLSNPHTRSVASAMIAGAIHGLGSVAASVPTQEDMATTKLRRYRFHIKD